VCAILFQGHSEGGATPFEAQRPRDAVTQRDVERHSAAKVLLAGQRRLGKAKPGAYPTTLTYFFPILQIFVRFFSQICVTFFTNL
jgi:hypothetical protein